MEIASSSSSCNLHTCRARFVPTRRPRSAPRARRPRHAPPPTRRPNGHAYDATHRLRPHDARQPRPGTRTRAYDFILNGYRKTMPWLRALARSRLVQRDVQRVDPPARPRRCVNKLAQTSPPCRAARARRRDRRLPRLGVLLLRVLGDVPPDRDGAAAGRERGDAEDRHRRHRHAHRGVVGPRPRVHDRRRAPLTATPTWRQRRLHGRGAARARARRRPRLDARRLPRPLGLRGALLLGHWCCRAGRRAARAAPRLHRDVLRWLQALLFVLQFPERWFLDKFDSGSRRTSWHVCVLAAVVSWSSFARAMSPSRA